MTEFTYFTPAADGVQPPPEQPPAAPQPQPQPEPQPAADAPAQAAVAVATEPGATDPPPEELIPANQPPWLRTVIASLHKRLLDLEDRA